MEVAMATAAEKAKMKKQEEQWEAEEDLRTLQRAAEIKADPKRLKRAKAQANKVMSALSDID
jgi:hypothetical protein